MAARGAGAAARAHAPCRRIDPFPGEQPVCARNCDSLCAGARAFRVDEGKNIRSTTASPRAIQLSSRPTRQNLSACRRMQFSQAPRRRCGAAGADAPIPIVFVLVSIRRAGVCSESLAARRQHHGFSSYDASMIGKWLQLLKEVAPGVTRVAVIFNPDTDISSSRSRRRSRMAACGTRAADERMRRVGVLSGLVANDPVGQARLARFQQALQQLGWIEGGNLRSTSGGVEAMPTTFANARRNLLRSGPDVILATASSTGAFLQADRSVQTKHGKQFQGLLSFLRVLKSC